MPHGSPFESKMHARDADARVVALGDESREEVELAVGPARGRGIQDAADLVRVTRFWIDHQIQRAHVEAAHDCFPGDTICTLPSPRHAITVWITRAVSHGSRTRMLSHAGLLRRVVVTAGEDGVTGEEHLRARGCRVDRAVWRCRRPCRCPVW